MYLKRPLFRCSGSSAPSLQVTYKHLKASSRISCIQELKYATVRNECGNSVCEQQPQSLLMALQTQLTKP